MFKVIFTLEGRKAETEFQADNGQQGADLFARVHPEVGSILVTNSGHVYQSYLVRSGEAHLIN